MMMFPMLTEETPTYICLSGLDCDEAETGKISRTAPITITFNVAPKEAKLFEKYGLYADPVAMRGSGESSKAMIGGSIQVAPIATPTVINAGLSGSDLVILAHTLPGVVHAMIVKPEIKRVEDLKGKKVGVTTFGSLTDFLVRHIL